MNQDLEDIREEFIEAAGHMTQSFGAGRVIGQVFAHVYFSRDAQTLDDMTLALSISKGSASMTVRQLEQWSALKKVWVKGDRKDYYEASAEFGMVVRKILFDAVGRTVELSDNLLDHAEERLNGAPTDKAHDSTDWEFVQKRVRLMRLFRDRVQKMWNSSIVKMLLK